MGGGGSRKSCNQPPGVRLCFGTPSHTQTRSGLSHWQGNHEVQLGPRGSQDAPSKVIHRAGPVLRAFHEGPQAQEGHLARQATGPRLLLHEVTTHPKGPGGPVLPPDASRVTATGSDPPGIQSPPSWPPGQGQAHRGCMGALQRDRGRTGAGSTEQGGQTRGRAGGRLQGAGLGGPDPATGRAVMHPHVGDQGTSAVAWSPRRGPEGRVWLGVGAMGRRIKGGRRACEMQDPARNCRVPGQAATSHRPSGTVLLLDRHVVGAP